MAAAKTGRKGSGRKVRAKVTPKLNHRHIFKCVCKRAKTSCYFIYHHNIHANPLNILKRLQESKHCLWSNDTNWEYLYTDEYAEEL